MGGYFEYRSVFVRVFGPDGCASGGLERKLFVFEFTDEYHYSLISYTWETIGYRSHFGSRYTIRLKRLASLFSSAGSNPNPDIFCFCDEGFFRKEGRVPTTDGNSLLRGIEEM